MTRPLAVGMTLHHLDGDVLLAISEEHVVVLHEAGSWSESVGETGDIIQFRGEWRSDSDEVLPLDHRRWHLLSAAADEGGG